MFKRCHPCISGIAALAFFLSAGASLAANAYSGSISDGEYITVPDGTVNDWAVLVSPLSMGHEEPNSEGDNALLKAETYIVQVNQYTWRVVARFKFKWWDGSSRNGIWYSGSANYMLVRK